MLVNVAQQLKESVGSARSYRVNETIDAGDGDSNLVQGNIMLMRTDQGILAKGILHTVSEITCCRCLRLFDCSLTLNIEHEYFPIADPTSGARLPKPEDGDSFVIDEQHILNLTEAIRQSELLAMPMKPLCHQDCAGLCPACGHNLNLGSCNCPQRKLDPRWSKLSQLTVSCDTLVNRKEGK